MSVLANKLRAIYLHFRPNELPEFAEVWANFVLSKVADPPQTADFQAVPNYRLSPGTEACVECDRAVNFGDELGLRCGLYHFSVDPEFICDSFIAEGAEFADRDGDLEADIKAALSLSFATKSSASAAVKKKNCTPGKSHWCQAPGGKGTCISIKKKCKYQPAGTQQQVANAIGASVPTASQKKATVTQTKSKAGPIKTNQAELDAVRSELERQLGTRAVEEAEKNVKRIVNDPDTNVFIRVGSSETLEKILSDRFRTSAELGIDTHQIPYLRDGYQQARNRVEAKVLGYDEQTTKPGDRPIYGYLGSNDLKGNSHKDVSREYGSIAIKLKSDIKDRTTFTAADSFKSGIASQIKNDDPPPPPNAASIVAATRHGYDVDKLPGHYPSYYNTKSAYGSQIRRAAQAKTIDDLADIGAPTGNRYVEAQIHGAVTPKDIAEIHFSPTRAEDRPTAAIAKFARDNKIDLYVDGKKLSATEIDELINPPKDFRSKTLRDLSSALDRGDFAEISKHADKIFEEAVKLELAPGELDRMLKRLFQESGYDRLPKVVDSADIDKIWEDGGLLMVRGVKPYPPTDPTRYLRQFQTGDYFVGNGMYGNGTYVGHSGDASGTKFIHRPSHPAIAAQFAKNAVDNVAKHDYIKETTLNFRMALDKNSRVALQSDLLREQKALNDQLEKWHASEIVRIRAEQSRIEQQPGDSDDSKKYTAAYKQAESDNAVFLTAKPKQSKKTSSGTKTIFDYAVKVPGRSDIVKFDLIKDLSSKSPTWSYIDADGQLQTVKTKKEAMAKALQAAVAKKTQAEALQASGFKTPPPTKNQLIVAKRKEARELEGRVRRMRSVLGLTEDIRDARGIDKRGISNLAVIKGYDAIALDESYQKDVFMNLLNRSVTYIQKDPLDWKRAQIKGAA